MAFGDPAPVSPDILGATALSAMPQMPLPPMAAAIQQSKPKMNWLGILADALSGAAGMPALHTQSLLRQKALKQQMDYEEQQRQQRNQDSRNNFLFEEGWKAQHPEMGETERLINEAATLPDSDPRKAIIMRKINGNDDPIVTLTLPGDRIYSGPRSGLAAALSGASGPSGNQLPRVTDKASYDALPAGSQFMDPQGNIRTKGGQSGASSTGGFL